MIIIELKGVVDWKIICSENSNPRQIQVRMK